MTGPRFTVRTLATLFLIALCVVAVVAVCMALDAVGAQR